MSEQEGHSPERANAMSDKASKVMVRSSAFTHRRVVARSLEGMSRRVMLPGLCFFFQTISWAAAVCRILGRSVTLGKLLTLSVP